MGDTFWVYIMTNKTRTVLYTGMTNDLTRRVWEHRHPTGTGFAARYSCNRLVYCDSFPTALDAIAAEKRIKGWQRIKKDTLIWERNPNWNDLAEDWYD
jgi:putative endonuclease